MLNGAESMGQVALSGTVVAVCSNAPGNSDRPGICLLTGPPRRELDLAWTLMDTDGNGTVSFLEFVPEMPKYGVGAVN